MRIMNLILHATHLISALPRASSAQAFGWHTLPFAMHPYTFCSFSFASQWGPVLLDEGNAGRLYPDQGYVVMRMVQGRS
jgi:hypothetical protein